MKKIVTLKTHQVFEVVKRISNSDLMYQKFEILSKNRKQLLICEERSLYSDPVCQNSQKNAKNLANLLFFWFIQN